ncbi:Hypothetical_protein [Hexamita inflata]|uniref:Hypothetical_protein n=1 Tax=Hexamita inflata TaxID=28002 RepID=A0AA86NKD5_9EUKA|nr:Hypothetical protein HINF_LOCUS8578 [Hexamita inflata]
MPPVQLTGQQQFEIIQQMSAYLEQTSNIALVKHFFTLSEAGRRRVLQFASSKLNLPLQLVTKWFVKQFSQCAFNQLEPYKIQILQLIISTIPYYTSKCSLTTFVRDSLIDFQDANELHPGKFYDYVYQMCGKFSKSKNQMAMLQIELDLMISQQKKKDQLIQQRKQLSEQILHYKQRPSIDSIRCEDEQQFDQFDVFDQLNQFDQPNQFENNFNQFNNQSFQNQPNSISNTHQQTQFNELFDKELKTKQNGYNGQTERTYFEAGYQELGGLMDDLFYSL